MLAAQAIDLALAGKSFVVTIGTGSGRSLCYFVPIGDAVLKAKRAGGSARTRALIVYPMNALANSQQEFLGDSDGSSAVTFARYTGQEGQDERQRIKQNPPEIPAASCLCGHDPAGYHLRKIATAFGVRSLAVEDHRFSPAAGAQTGDGSPSVKIGAGNTAPPRLPRSGPHHSAPFESVPGACAPRRLPLAGTGILTDHVMVPGLPGRAVLSAPVAR
jgi:DEAD/DEAH box helicase